MTHRCQYPTQISTVWHGSLNLFYVYIQGLMDGMFITHMKTLKENENHVDTTEEEHDNLGSVDDFGGIKNNLEALYFGIYFRLYGWNLLDEVKARQSQHIDSHLCCSVTPSTGHKVNFLHCKIHTITPISSIVGKSLTTRSINMWSFF